MAQLPDKPQDRMTRPDPASPVSAQAAKGDVPIRRRRRWPLVVILGGFLVIIGVLAGAPHIVSLPAVTPWALSFANDRLAGEIQLSKLSLSWFGKTHVRGLRVLDPDDEEVLTVDEITGAGGVWRLLTSSESFETLVIDKPDVTLRINDKDEISLVRAFQPRGASADSDESSALPELRGRVTVQGGRVRVMREGGAAYEVRRVEGEVELATLDKIVADVALDLQDGSKLTGKVDLSQLTHDGKLAMGRARGTVAIKTEGEVDIGPAAAVAAPDMGLAGRTNVQLDARLTGGGVDGDFTIGVAGLQSKQGKDSTVKPIDLSLRGKARMADEQVTADLAFTGEAGTASAEITYRTAGRATDVPIGKLVGAILAGESITLPDFLVNANASVDLAALDRAVPGLLRVREGRRISAGKLEVAALSVSGGATPAATGDVRLENLIAEGGAGRVTLQPISLDFDASLEAGKGLNVRKASLASSFARLDASGTPVDVRAKIDADLTRLRQELGSIFDFGGMELAGRVTGDLEMARAGEQINVKLDATAESARYVSGDVQLDLPRAAIRQTGHFKMKDGGVERFVADRLDADLGGEIVAGGSGWYAFDSGAFKADADVSRADLGFFSNRLRVPGVEALRRYSGLVTAQVAAECAGGSAPITAAGKVIAQRLSVDGKPLTTRETNVQLAGGTFASDMSQVQLARMQVESELAMLTASDIRLLTGGGLEFEGKLEGAGDMARIAGAIAQIAQMDEKPDISGQLQIKTAATSSGKKVQFTGSGGIDGMDVGVGESRYREQRVSFDYDATLDSRADSIAVQFIRLASRPLKAEIKGSIDQYSTSRVLALTGRYDASWNELTTILHTMFPGTVEIVAVNGTSSSEFKVTGPAMQAGAQPEFRGVRSELAIDWQSATILGERLGAAKFLPALEDGRIHVPVVSMAVEGGGQARLGGTVDFTPGEPTLRIGDRLNILEDVVVTRELAASLLSRINPIFMYMNKVEGRASLAAQKIVLPLGESMKRQGDGVGRLDLVDFKVAPSGLMNELLVLGGQPRDVERAVLVSGLDFVIKEGRIHYKDFTMTFPPDFDVKFYGSVGLDETLDLIVSLPVKAALLERMGIKGPIVEYAELLTGSRLDIPLVGTRGEPKLDFSNVDPKPLVDRAIQGLARKQATDLLGGGNEKKGLLPGGLLGGGQGESKGEGRPKADDPGKKSEEKPASGDGKKRPRRLQRGG